MCSESSSFQNPVAKVYVGLSLVGGLVAILALTSGGNSVVSEMQLLKQALLQCSERIAGRSSNVIRAFILLSDGIRDSNLTVTGWGMFTVNKALMLTIGGMVITYSFLLFQLN
ncbi:uncharacterized protein CEXT_112371 [Caerostris extrusa]|uniref:Uncharacterized protein n=1 Tax=Caerostris extrusa TaxID=172846 RepID=A0AAV4WGU8_CAEEX|nr:uncharacterized protein CEXT_112371 [Caerostris extrusa]